MDRDKTLQTAKNCLDDNVFSTSIDMGGEYTALFQALDHETSTGDKQAKVTIMLMGNIPVGYHIYKEVDTAWEFLDSFSGGEFNPENN